MMRVYELDTQGLVCPEPLMLVRNRVRELQRGDVLLVRATDPSTRRDLNNFCRFMGHEMEHQEEEVLACGTVYTFRIRKAGN